MKYDPYDMTLEDLRREWDAIKVERKSPEELMMMTRASGNPRLRKMRIQLAAECVMVVALIFTVLAFSDLFSEKPWMTLVFIACGVLFIFTDFLGYTYMTVLPEGGNVRESLAAFYSRMKRMTKLSTIANSAVSVCALLVFNNTGPMKDPKNMLWVLVMTIALTFAVLYSSKWDKWRADMKVTLKEFDETE